MVQEYDSRVGSDKKKHDKKNKPRAVPWDNNKKQDNAASSGTVAAEKSESETSKDRKKNRPAGVH
jgi:hypothetical protein